MHTGEVQFSIFAAIINEFSLEDVDATLPSGKLGHGTMDSVAERSGSGEAGERRRHHYPLAKGRGAPEGRTVYLLGRKTA